MRSKYRPDPQPSDRFYVRVPEPVKRSVFEVADEEGLTASQFVRRAVLVALESRTGNTEQARVA